MSDLDKELNFDDIAGKKVQGKSPKKKSIPNRTPGTTGTVLAIPTGNSDAWVCKDLAECTGAEFVAWARGVYPISLSEDKEKFRDIHNRIRAFKSILYYHTTSLFQVGKEGKRNATVN